MVFESTVAIIKPGAFEKSEQILETIKANGFTVSARDITTISKPRAADLYNKLKSKPNFDDIVNYLNSGPSLILALRRDNAIEVFRKLAGPDDPEEARVEAPFSLQARFGKSLVKNAIHASQSPAAAARELAFFFPDYLDGNLSGSSAKNYIQAAVAPLLHEALTEMCRCVPADPVDWFAEYVWNNVKGAKLPKPQTSHHQPKIYFLLGNAGSGKGTQSSKIVEKFGYAHLSAGDLLRAEVDSGSSSGEMILDFIKQGKIVPGEVTVGLLKSAIKKNCDKPGILIDGFPRAAKQAGMFENMVCDFEFAIYFDCPEEELERRLLKRGTTSGRVDDNIDSIRLRFQTFKEQSMPIIEYYEAKGKLHRLDAARNESDIFEDVCNILEST